MDYETLRIIWWVLLGVLLIGFAAMDGFDLGTAALLPIVARTDIERRIAINTVGPVWEGNQVWLITGAGAIFAAWPILYAAAFSGFYLAMLLALASLILRPVGFKFRSKIDDPRWRTLWDCALVIGGVVPSLVFGIAFGNLFVGVPFSFAPDARFMPTISLISLLNPFALLSGLISLSMIGLHGASWLAYKASDEVARRARATIPWAGLAFVILFTVAGIWMSHLPGYAMGEGVDHNGLSSPLAGHAAAGLGAWGTRFGSNPAFWLAPFVAYLGVALAVAFSRRHSLLALISSALVPLGVIASAGLTLFPFLLPSSSDPAMSLTLWNASSSKLTLWVMLGVVVIFMPIIIAYTSYVYRVLRGPVTAESVNADHHSY
ncbi:MAG TPA: cytochrome d ubiquinol oxidase subunit II [Magnetospirillaceae bacterium]|jgi:cytochrome d ubiquinol oxidase subunit II